jgi:hypothetical protein
VDEQTRQRLLEKRRMAQARRSRAELSVAFRNVAPVLCGAGHRFSKLMPAANRRLLGALASGPGADEELDFNWIPGAQTSRWSDKGERDLLCCRALRAVAGDDERVAVIWHPAKAGIRLAASALRSQVTLLLDEGGGDTIWIVSGRGGHWIIQVAFWSGTVSYAKNVPLRTDAR